MTGLILRATAALIWMDNKMEWDFYPYKKYEILNESYQKYNAKNPERTEGFEGIDTTSEDQYYWIIFCNQSGACFIVAYNLEKMQWIRIWSK